MSRSDRATAVRAALSQRWQNGNGNVFDVRQGRRLVLDREPEFIVGDGGELVGVDAWVRLFNPGQQEVKIDPHRRFINPPTVPLAGTQDTHGNGPEDVTRVVTPNPESAFWEALWDSVDGTPNPRGWRTAGTVTTVFSDTSDGRCFSESPVYATARTALGTFTVSTTGVEHGTGQLHDGTNYNCVQSFLRFDTSAIADNDIIATVVLDMWLTADSSTGSVFITEVRDSDWGATLTSADYISGASLTGLTLVASIDSNGIGATGAYKTFTSETAFKSMGNFKTGFVNVMLSSSRQRTNNAPGTNTQEFCNWSFADAAGTTQDPKLTITHAAPTSGLFQRKPYRIWRRH